MYDLWTRKWPIYEEGVDSEDMHPHACMASPHHRCQVTAPGSQASPGEEMGRAGRLESRNYSEHANLLTPLICVYIVLLYVSCHILVESQGLAGRAGTDQESKEQPEGKEEIQGHDHGKE